MKRNISKSINHRHAFNELLKNFFYMILPVLLLMTVLMLIIFFMIVPLLNEKHLHYKKEMCKRLVEVALSDLESRNEEVKNGNISLEEAQNRALRRLKNFRFGKDGRDYYWIINSDSVLLMHPYRGDLVGINPEDVDVSMKGELFIKLLSRMSIISQNPEGAFIEYFWHWKNDLSRIEKKISYVKKFAPWKWIIGTGIYIEDIKKEQRKLARNFIFIGLLLTGVSCVFAFFLSLRNTRLRIKEHEVVEKLRINEDKFRSIFRYSPLAISINSLPDGEYLSVNPAFSELTGIDTDSIYAMNWKDTGLIPGGEQDGELFWELLDKGNISNIETVYNYSGEVKNIFYSAVLIEFETRSAVLSMMSDITKQKRVEEALRQSQKLDVVGQLAGGIAHDFNNMLTGTMGGAEILSMKLGEDSPLQKHVELILKSARRASDLTRRILSFSRDNKTNLSEMPFDIHDVINEAIDILNSSIDKNVRIVKKMNARSSVVKGDPTLLQNVFLNLGLNSRDSMADGGTLTFSTNEIFLGDEFCRKYGYERSNGPYIQIDVSDTGIGMSPETIERAFDPFFTTKPEGKGTGLGLSMVYRTVRDHSGIINVYSELGTGTIFKIYLPSAKDSRREMFNEDAAVPGRGRVLVIDDEEVVRTNAMTFLENLGYSFESAANGYEGVEIFSKEPDKFDLIIIDLIMPGLNGLQTSKKLKEYNPEVRILFSSGFNREISYEEIIECGGCGFIQKPYRLVPFSKAVAEALSQKDGE